MNHLANRISSRLNTLSPAQRQALLKKLKQKQTDSRPSVLTQPIPVYPADTACLPVSCSQRRLWFIEQLDPNKPTYHIASAFKLSGSVKAHLLQEAIAIISQRHPILRTVFNDDALGVTQSVLPEINSHMSITALREQSLKDLLNKAVSTPFDLRRGPLFRIQLIALSASEFVLSLVMHHMIADAWSCKLLLTEMSDIYTQLLKGGRKLSSDPGRHYGEYALWQQALLAEPSLQRQRNYWHKQLEHINNIQLPIDAPRPPVMTCHGNFHRLLIDHGTIAPLMQHCRTRQVSLFHGLMSLYQILLFRLCQQDDFAIGMPVSGRQHEDTHTMIGFFVNTLAIRNDATHGVDFNQLLEKVKNRTLNAQSHQDIPFDVLLDDLSNSFDASYSPIFQVFFNYNPDKIKDQVSLPGINVTVMNNDTNTAKFDLSLMISHVDEGLCCHFEYNADIFQAKTIASFAQCFEQLLSAASASPCIPVDQLPLVSDSCRQSLLNLGSAPAQPPTICDIATLIEQQVARTPNKLAIIAGRHELTFDQLNQKANTLAQQLRKRGVQANDAVGLYLYPGMDFMIALFATIKLQAVYVPMDRMFPAARLTLMLKQANINTLIHSHGEQPDWVQDITLIDVSAEDSGRATATEAMTNPQREHAPDTPLYMLYTSGTTGTPKAAMISHRNESNLLHWYARYFNLTAADKLLVFSASGFDLTQKNLLAPLCFGAELHFTVSPFYDPDLIRQTIQDKGISWINCAPSAFYPIIEHCQDFTHLRSLRRLLLGGEPIQINKLSAWLSHTDCQSELFNMYGPTECTDIATTCRYESLGSSLPIGRPIDNVQLYVLDEQQALLPQGAIGELCIAGASVGLGYFNNDEANERHFMPNPFSQHAHDNTLYRTGDLVRYRPNGQLEFIGRRDHQLKIRGFRVEATDIESHLKNLPAVNDAAVCIRLFNDQPVLIAFLATDIELASAVEYKRLLSTQLADFMIPVAFFPIDRIPLNNNGKIDREQLPAVELSRLQAIEYIAPRNTIEAELADIWCCLLGVKRVGVLDDFFESGGHSLLATQLLVSIRERFYIDLPMRTLFEVSTIEGLAEVIFSMQNAPEASDNETYEEGIL